MKWRPLYERYKNLLPYYQIIRNPKEPDILLIKCTYCGNYYEPSFDKLKHIKAFINGNNNKKLSVTPFCCSTHCKKYYSDITEIRKAWKKKNNDKWYAKLRLKQIKISKSILKIKKVRTKGSVRKRQRPTNPEALKIYTSTKLLERLTTLKIDNPKNFKLTRLLYYSRVRAKEKGIINTLTLEWLKEKTINDKCELTELNFSYDPNIPRNPFGPSIDRINIKEGYTPENCRIVLWVVNAGLGHYTEKDLYTICKAYLNFNNIK